jgi:hypothetical protein
VVIEAICVKGVYVLIPYQFRVQSCHVWSPSSDHIQPVSDVSTCPFDLSDLQVMTIVVFP